MNRQFLGTLGVLTALVSMGNNELSAIYIQNENTESSFFCQLYLEGTEGEYDAECKMILGEVGKKENQVTKYIEKNLSNTEPNKYLNFLCYEGAPRVDHPQFVKATSMDSVRLECQPIQVFSLPVTLTEEWKNLQNGRYEIKGDFNEHNVIIERKI